jgi:hypothetical protein
VYSGKTPKFIDRRPLRALAAAVEMLSPLETGATLGATPGTWEKPGGCAAMESVGPTELVGDGEQDQDSIGVAPWHGALLNGD